MSFETEVVKDGRGVLFKLDVSFDNFATITYGYSTAGGIDPDFAYDPRIIGIGNLTRGLGNDRLIQASTVDLVLGNEDEGADWLVDQATAADALSARFRLYIGLFDPDSALSGSGILYKQLGEFVALEPPRRTFDRIQLTLSDDALGFMGDAVSLPTFEDWYNADATSANPLRNLIFEPNATDFAQWAPIQLAFGDDWVPLDMRNRAEITRGTDANSSLFAICATTSTAAVTSDDVTSVFIRTKFATVTGYYGEGPIEHELPSTALNPQTGSTETLWEARKGASITKDGKTFQVLWLKINWGPLFGFFSRFVPNNAGNAPLSIQGDLSDIAAQIDQIWVKGFPLSARTNTTAATQHPVDVIRDLVTYYSKGSSSNVDSARLNRVKAAYSSGQSASGVVLPGDATSDASLADAITSICASFDFDAFVSFSGKLALSGRTIDYESQASLASIRSIDETRITDFEEQLPAREQRGAPFTRIVLEGFKDTPDSIRWRIPSNVYDDPDAADYGKIFTTHRRVDWINSSVQRENPWTTRNIDKTFRPRIHFRTDLEGLLYELGDYVRVTWTRNLGDPYVDTIFQIESLALACGPDSFTVEIEALWADDLSSDLAYILDDEQYLAVATGSGARTATVQDLSNVVTFSSGNLLTDGVQVGDHLVLMDATEGATSFMRNKAVKITEVTDATHLKVLDLLDSLGFGASSPVAVSTWEIRHSHLTYPTFASDPTNYPDGSNFYGCASSSEVGGYSGVGTRGFSTGHKMLDG